MRQLLLNKKTGFKILNPNKAVIIRDFRNKLFYETESRLPTVKYFNLPPGKYYVDAGQIRVLTRPIKYRLPQLPERERFNKPFPFNFSFHFSPNPNKCTIFWNRKQIVCDPQYKNAPLPVLYFMLFHEFAHSKYGTEKFADLGAARMMLQKGFNPSQIMRAPIDTLSKKQLLRKNFIVNKVNNLNAHINE